MAHGSHMPLSQSHVLVAVLKSYTGDDITLVNIMRAYQEKRGCSSFAENVGDSHAAVDRPGSFELPLRELL